MTTGTKHRRPTPSALAAGAMLAATLLAPGYVPAQDLDSHGSGIWSIADSPGMSRWLVIHEPQTSNATGVYHIEVIGRRAADPAWRIIRLVPHMAITREALQRSVVAALQSGAVYPESFDEAYTAWQAQNHGAGGGICTSTVVECIPEWSDEK